jgi:7,8-dihydropterin-6-yl-methyl-4-(beta-D-ribofuranosyl)aminobenzene 5'-phosphate synthase
VFLETKKENIFPMKKWLSNLILAGINFIRKRLARIKIRQEVQAFSNFAPLKIDETKTLEILPLYEAVSQNELQSGMGVSYLIRTDSATILFDLGNNPSAVSPSPLEQNMAQLGIALDKIDLMVISHRHPDHVGGRKWWDKKTFSPNGIAQPALGTLPIYIPEKVTYPGSNPTLTKKPTRLTNGVATTGTFTFVEPYPVWEIRPNDSEQALAVNVTGQGIVLIVGCGHMGLKALLTRAETVFDAPIIGVVGGLHYSRADADALQPEIRLLEEHHPRIVALSPHDSGPVALEAFERAFPTNYQPIRVGEAIQIGNKVE